MLLNHNTHLISVDTDVRPAKRQKTEGMNLRYNHMVRTVNTINSPFGDEIPRSCSRRSQIASSSSAAASDLPIQSDLQNTTLIGGDRLPLERHPYAPKAMENTFHSPAFMRYEGARDDSSEASLPTWLEGTISTLDNKHPLRLLLPQEHSTYPIYVDRQSSPSGLEPSSEACLTAEPEDPPSRHIQPAALSSPMSPHSTRSLGHRSAEKCVGDPAPGEDVYKGITLPFSTPGPASSVSITASPVAPLTFAFAQHDHLVDPTDDIPAANILSFAPALPDRGLHASLKDVRNEAPALHHHLSPRSHTKLSSPSVFERYTREASVIDITPLPLDGQPTRPSAQHTLVRAGNPVSPIYHNSPFITRTESPPLSERFLSDIKPSSPPSAVPSLRPRPSQIAEFDFRWERFDRSDIILDASSPSPIRSANGDSEIAFWGLSDPHISSPPYALAVNAVARTEATLPTPPDESQASLPSRTVDDPPPQHTSNTHPIRPHSSLEAGKDQFAWIVPPRDEPALATPRATSDTVPSTPDPPSGRKGNGDPDHAPHDEGSDPTRGREGRNRSPKCAAFAPAPGIYVSPLRGNGGGGPHSPEKPADSDASRGRAVDDARTAGDGAKVNVKVSKYGTAKH